jgi:hypothetical protein
MSKKRKRVKGASEGDLQTPIRIDFHEISDHIAELISHENLPFEVDINIKFDNETLTDIGDDVKLVAKAVAGMIENGDGYSWVYVLKSMKQIHVSSPILYHDMQSGSAGGLPCHHATPKWAPSIWHVPNAKNSNMILMKNQTGEGQSVLIVTASW